MADARERLLRQVMTHVADHGLSDTSLRDLADAVGTSHRMLHYHFGGREGLVAAIVAAMESDQREALGAVAAAAESPAQLVTTHWEALTQPEVLPFVRLFFEVLALASHGRPGTEGFLDELTEPWIQAGRSAAERIGVEVDDTDLRLGVALTRGLLVDVIASGEVEPARRALERFLDVWYGQGSGGDAARD